MKMTDLLVLYENGIRIDRFKSNKAAGENDVIVEMLKL